MPQATPTAIDDSVTVFGFPAVRRMWMPQMVFSVMRLATPISSIPYAIQKAHHNSVGRFV